MRRPIDSELEGAPGPPGSGYQVPAGAKLRIYAFVNRYPSAYKPYYDVQFGELARSGHDLRIFTFSPEGTKPSRRFEEYGLARLTTRLPSDSLADLARGCRMVLESLVRDPGRRLGLLRRLALRSGVPVRVRLKESIRGLMLPVASPDLVLVHGHRTMHRLLFLKTLWPSAPLGLYYHGGTPPEVESLSGGEVREIFRVPDLILTVSRYARSELQQWVDTNTQAVVLPMGFAVDEFIPPSPRPYRVGGALRLVSIGRLSEGKGHRYLLRAMKLLCDEGLPVRLTIVGSGPLRRELEALAHAEGVREPVEFMGTLDNATAMQLLGEADALVLASHATATWTETQGTVIQEAMLMGAIPVTTATGGVPESIPEEFRRFQVKPADPRALARAIREVAALPEEEMVRLGVLGRDWTRKRFDIRLLNQELLSLLAGKRRLGSI